MPTTPAEDQQALDWLTENRDDPQADMVAEKLGVGADHVDAWKFAKDNPNDPRSVQIKNKIYNDIANNTPAIQEQGVGFWDRFVVKNLIDREPEVQAKYLERKGFDVRFDEDGNIETRAPGETRYSAVDPRGFDFFDVTDIAGDVLEGIITGAATGAKALGVVTAGATAGASIPLSMVAGGAATQGYEFGKQSLAKGLGYRDEYNPAKLGESFVSGAVFPGAMKAAGSAGKYVGSKLGSGIQKLTGGAGLKPDAQKIKAAAKELGVKPTPAQLIDNPLLAKFESAQSQAYGKFGGRGLRKQIEQNKKIIQQESENIVREASGRTAYEIGQEAEDAIVRKTAERLKPAEDIYNKYETLFKRKAYRPDVSGVKNTIAKLKDDFEFNKNALRLLNEIDGNVDNVKNLTQIKKLRTDMGDLYDPMDKAKSRISTAIRGELTQVRGETLKRLINRERLKASLGGESSAPFFKKAISDIEEADSIYKGVVGDVEKTLLPRGKKVKMSPKKQVEDFMEKTPAAERINKILRTNDPDKIEAVKNAFPEAYDVLRSGKIQDVVFRSEVKGGISPQKLVKNLDKLPKETVNLIFGPDANRKVAALKVYLGSIPDMVGKSGTPGGQEIFDTLSLRRQAASVGRDFVMGLINRYSTGKDVFSKAGRLLESPRSVGSAMFGGRQIQNMGQRPQESGLPVDVELQMKLEELLGNPKR